MVLISAYSKRDCCTTRAIDIRTIDHHPLAGLNAGAQMVPFQTATEHRKLGQ
jgi:hypothetical protein